MPKTDEKEKGNILYSCKERTKESTPCEKPISSFATDFSGIAELTELRSAHTCCNSLSEKTLRTRGFSKGVMKASGSYNITYIMVKKIKSY